MITAKTHVRHVLKSGYLMVCKICKHICVLFGMLSQKWQEAEQLGCWGTTISYLKITQLSCFETFALSYKIAFRGKAEEREVFGQQKKWK